MKELYIYDAKYNLKTITTYEKVADITGSTKNTLASLKCKGKKLPRLKDCYLIDGDTNINQLRRWYEDVKFKNEVWKPIDDIYQISNYGRLKKKYKKYSEGKFVLPYCRIKKYKTKMILKIHNKEIFVHKLVAQYFVENIFNHKNVYHKNGILHDNYHMNLAYISREELGKLTGYKSNKNSSIIAIDNETNEIIDWFRSTREAAKKLFTNRQSISDWLNGKTKVVSGMYRFEYEK